VTRPQYPQKNNRETIAVFGTTRTIESGVYVEEIRKRCPHVQVVQQACPALAGAIEAARPRSELSELIRDAVAELCTQALGGAPDRALLGCTHFAVAEALFRRELPARTRLLSQPDAVADSLEDYLARHPEYATPSDTSAVRLLTTGAVAEASRTAAIFWPGAPAFTALG